MTSGLLTLRQAALAGLFGVMFAALRGPGLEWANWVMTFWGQGERVSSRTEVPWRGSRFRGTPDLGRAPGVHTHTHTPRSPPCGAALGRGGCQQQKREGWVSASGSGTEGCTVKPGLWAPPQSRNHACCVLLGPSAHWACTHNCTGAAPGLTSGSWAGLGQAASFSLQWWTGWTGTTLHLLSLLFPTGGQSRGRMRDCPVLSCPGPVLGKTEPGNLAWEGTISPPSPGKPKKLAAQIGA